MRSLRPSSALKRGSTHLKLAQANQRPLSSATSANPQRSLGASLGTFGGLNTGILNGKRARPKNMCRDMKKTPFFIRFWPQQGQPRPNPNFSTLQWNWRAWCPPALRVQRGAGRGEKKHNARFTIAFSFAGTGFSGGRSLLQRAARPVSELQGDGKGCLAPKKSGDTVPK